MEERVISTPRGERVQVSIITKRNLISGRRWKLWISKHYVQLNQKKLLPIGIYQEGCVACGRAVSHEGIEIHKTCARIWAEGTSDLVDKYCRLYNMPRPIGEKRAHVTKRRNPFE